MREERSDAFTGVLGSRRGSVDGRRQARELTDLDRARELVPLIHVVLAGDDIVASVTALRRRAHELGVEVLHGVFRDDEDSGDEHGLTLLRSVGRDELIGVVELNPDGRARLLRPEQPRWTQ